ncbi:MAG TPA: amino acid ABC transporter substrate-binding protein [Xanthobacteraceae bacterium]|nr:amino acid ABC transporter substrate-binding protein [Xanthobacteraceae bacterium]
MHHLSHRAWPRAGLFGAGALTALCLAPAPGRAADIVIGATASETGAFAVDANYHLKGEELAVDDANAHGGWLGRKVALKHYDDKSDPGTAVRLYTRLVTEDRVDLLIGPYSSGITQAVVPLINKYKMATIDPGASLPDIFAAGNKWNFQGLPPSSTYLDALLPLAKDHGAKTVAILALKSAYSLACASARTAQAKQLGFNIVYQTTYTLPQPDFSSIALAVKNADPDVVIACSYFPDSVGIAQGLHQDQFAPKFLAATIGPAEAEFPKTLGPVADGIMSNTSWWPTLKTPDNAGFVARYKAKYNGETPDYHAASGYAAVQTLGAAVAATGSTDQEKIRDWLTKNEVPTVQGTFKVDANGLSTGFHQYMLQIQNGALKLIEPPADAQAKPIIPYTGS